MVRLHVVDNQIIYSPVSDGFPDFSDKLLPPRFLHSVNQRNFLIDNEIGIVTDPIRQRPQPLKKCRGFIIYPDIMYTFTDSFHK